MKHEYHLDKLEFDQNSIKNEMRAKGINLDVSGSSELIKIIRLNVVDN